MQTLPSATDTASFIRLTAAELYPELEEAVTAILYAAYPPEPHHRATVDALLSLDPATPERVRLVLEGATS